MNANLRVLVPLITLALFTCACRTEGERQAERRREEQDRNSAAFKAGEAAHQVAREAEKAGAAAARELDESAKKAREGWKAQDRKDREQK